MTSNDFANNMAARAFHRELIEAQMLGYNLGDCFARAFRVMDETFDAVLAPDRPLLTLGLRMVRR